MYRLPEAIQRFSENPVKIPMAYLMDLVQIFQKYMETQKTPNYLNNIEKEEQSWKDHTT